MKEKKKSFNCSIEDMYAVALMSWNFCSDNLSSFTAGYPFYNKKFVNENIAQIEDAQELLNEQQRVADTSKERQLLIEAADDCLLDWQLLKTYISNGFSEPMAEIYQKEAGSAFYPTSAKYNWTSMKSLLKMGNAFLKNYSADLIERSIMPAGFVEKFTTDAATCSQNIDSFKKAVATKITATGDKSKKDSQIHTNAINMMRDGRQVFVNNKNLQHQFVFSRLLAIVRGNKQASLSGYTYNASKQPVEGAVIASKDGQYTATTNKKGRYEIGGILAGDYMFTITCPGYAPVEQAITLAAGTNSRVSFNLQNLMKKVA